MFKFWLSVGALIANVLLCGGAFFSGSTGILIPGFLLFLVLYGLAAFRAGRDVVIRSPLAPKEDGWERR